MLPSIYLFLGRAFRLNRRDIIVYFQTENGFFLYVCSF